MPHKCSKIWFLSKTSPKSLPKRGVSILGFQAFWRPDSKMAPEWAPDLQIIKKSQKNTQIFNNMFKHFCTFGNRFFLRFAAQNSICFALPTSLFHRAAGQATRWNKSLGPPRLHSRSCFFMSVGFRKNIWFGYYFLQAFLQFLAANLSGLRRSTYSDCISKLSLQTVRGCGDGTPQASSIISGSKLLPMKGFAT